MASEVTEQMRKTPASVKVKAESRPPETDPRLGIPVAPGAAKPATHRLVSLGDSLTHGFQSGAIYNTESLLPAHHRAGAGLVRVVPLPALWRRRAACPSTSSTSSARLEGQFGDKLDWWELASAALLAALLRWTRSRTTGSAGAGARPPKPTASTTTWAIYGWDLRDALDGTAASLARRPSSSRRTTSSPRSSRTHNDRAALRVLPPLSIDRSREPSTVGAAEALGKDGGIETLIVFLGANNALGSVLALDASWSQGGSTGKDYQDLEKKACSRSGIRSTSRSSSATLVDAASRRSRRATSSGRPSRTSPSRPWRAASAEQGRAPARATSRTTRARGSPTPTSTRRTTRTSPRTEARAIDSAIDQYNETIVEAVKHARNEGPRLVSARHLRRARSARGHALHRRPGGAARVVASLRRCRRRWQHLTPAPDSWFFLSGPAGRTQGGLFSLDGVHPTTIAYGIVAQEFINVMQLAGVAFYYGDGKTQRQGPVTVDFKRLVALDTLISDPPRSLANDLGLVGWLDQKLDVFKRLL